MAPIPYSLAVKAPISLETPAVLVDRRILQANIAAMQNVAHDAQLNLRPHVKTHKSITIARQQMAAGAVGITASKVDEALVFIEARLPSVTVAHPQLAAGKLDRLLTAADRRGCDLRLIVDSPEGVALLAARAAALDVRPGVFIKIDVGLHRCGCQPDDPLVFTLAQTIRGTQHLRFRGLLSHAGQAYGAEDAATAGRMAEAEREIMTTLAESLRKAGGEVPEVSVGSTPTVMATQKFEGLSEIRPGNYVFMDQTPLRLGLITPPTDRAECAHHGGQHQRALCDCRCRRQNPQLGPRGPRHHRDRRLWRGLWAGCLPRYARSPGGRQAFRGTWFYHPGRAPS